jgi:hypothetical protein
MENVGDTWEIKREKKAGNKIGEADPYIGWVDGIYVAVDCMGAYMG